MALIYSSFQTFPLQIVGITSDYNAKIQAIENFVIADLAYSGEAGDLTAVLPYFVFWFFCNDTITTVFAETGENSQTKEFSTPETIKQVNAWNIGVEKLRVVCGITEAILTERMTGLYSCLEKSIIETILDENLISINTKYLSKRSLL